MLGRTEMLVHVTAILLAPWGTMAMNDNMFASQVLWITPHGLLRRAMFPYP